MIADRLCDKHGIELSVVHRKDGYLFRYCNPCRREKSNRTYRNGGERCRRDHLKTPWTWRWNQAARAYFCVTCKNERERERYHALRRAKLEAENGLSNDQGQADQAA